MAENESKRFSRYVPEGKLIFGDEAHTVEKGTVYLPGPNLFLSLNPDFIQRKPHRYGNYSYFDYNLQFYQLELPTEHPIEVRMADRMMEYGYVLVNGVIRCLGRELYFFKNELFPSNELALKGWYVDKEI